MSWFFFGGVAYLNRKWLFSENGFKINKNSCQYQMNKKSAMQILICDDIVIFPVRFEF
jgi:CMP-N-acetylneuraminic acid synthetase